MERRHCEVHADYEKANTATDFQARVSDLEDGHIVQVTCGVCEHTGMIDAQRLKRRFPPHERMTFIKKKLKCARCGNRGMNAWSVYKKPGKS